MAVSECSRGTLLDQGPDLTAPDRYSPTREGVGGANEPEVPYRSSIRPPSINTESLGRSRRTSSVCVVPGVRMRQSGKGLQARGRALERRKSRREQLFIMFFRRKSAGSHDILFCHLHMQMVDGCHGTRPSAHMGSGVHLGKIHDR